MPYEWRYRFRVLRLQTQLQFIEFLLSKYSICLICNKNAANVLQVNASDKNETQRISSLLNISQPLENHHDASMSNIHFYVIH
jgi:hypothetical protein